MDVSDPQIPAMPSTEESPSQKQARIRRERREAKIKAGGSARLDKISSLSGRPVEPAPPSSTDASPQWRQQAAPGSDDPDEVDITHHPFTSRASPSPRFGQNGPSEADLRQLLRSGGPPPDVNENQNPFAMPRGGGGGGGEEEDPMMRILQQMMGGGMPGEGGGGAGGLPPGLAAMLGGGDPAGMGMGGGGAEGGAQQQETTTSASLWKIVHALFALMLGIYVISTTPFTGSKLSRTASAVAGMHAGAGAGAGEEENIQTQPGVTTNFFWLFATAELILQSSRFFIERGKVSQGGGMMGMVAGFLPEPWKGYLALVGRYRGIYTTVVEDAAVVVFVLGLVAWWGGGVG